MNFMTRSLRTFAILSWSVCFLVSAISGPAFAAATPGKSHLYQGPFEQDVAGITRKAAEVYLPNQYGEKSAWPLVVLLHGYTGTGKTEDAYLTLRFRASKRGFILVTPDGLINSKGEHFWNSTDYCCDFEKTGVNDVDYLQKLIKSVQAQYHVDAKRIYLFGHSNGGFMANRLACEEGVHYAAIASFAGGTFKNPADCNSHEAIPFLQIHALNDTTIVYGDDPKYAGGEATVNQWVTRNGCSGEPTTAPKKDFVWALPGKDTTPRRWNQCASGSPVEFWTIDAGEAPGYKPHIPIFHLNFTDAVLDFLFAHSLK